MDRLVQREPRANRRLKGNVFLDTMMPVPWFEKKQVMTDPKKWEESDLQQLVDDGVEESLTLDYKACDALQKTDEKKIDVSKDVSAFANSVGGTIVYGMVEEGKKQKPKNIDKGYDAKDISKDWLDQVISSNIQPHIDGVFINRVDLIKNAPGRCAYVVCIPQSDRAPHQAADKRYYKRSNARSEAMEDYEVRDVMFRQRVPIVRLAEMQVYPHPERTDTGRLLNYDLTPIVRNEGRIVTQYFGLEVRVQEPFRISWGFAAYGCEPVCMDGDQTVLFQRGNGPLFPSRKQPLHPFSLQLHSRHILEKNVPAISIIIYADNMPPHKRPYEILKDGKVFKHILELEPSLAIFIMENFRRSPRPSPPQEGEE